MTDKPLDYVRKDIERLYLASKNTDTKVNNLITQENKNNEDIRAAQDDINQLYLLFNELLRSIKKDKDDGWNICKS